jgi:hypothetical protein
MKTMLLTVIGLSAHLLSLGQLAPPTNAPPSDADIRRMLIGTWGGDTMHKHSRTIYATNGISFSTNWVTDPNSVLNAVPYAESSWQVKDGTLISTVTKTTDPQLCPLGSVWRTKVILMNETGAVGVTSIGTTNTMARIK